jgi:dsDNA-specific endonuclease/ATPase MutS2
LACRERGILTVRVIHGKGTGSMRRTVHAILKKLPDVIDFKTGDLDSGSWGATLIHMAPLTSSVNKH